MPLAIRGCGVVLLACAAFALLTHGWNSREIIDDAALAAFGGALLLAAARPLQSWALFLFGALMSAVILIAGVLDWWYRAGLVLCLIVFTWVLLESYRTMLGRRRVTCPSVQRLAMRAKTQYGVSLDELSRLSPVLLVFLRHTGCTFCRETLADLARQRKAIEAEGVRLVLVFMADEGSASEALTRFGLDDVHRVCDAEQNVYRAFGLPRGSVTELATPNVAWRGLRGLLKGYGLSLPCREDLFQMPGVFVVFHGEILRSFRHQSIADRPDYLAIVQGDNLSEFEADAVL